MHNTKKDNPNSKSGCQPDHKQSGYQPKTQRLREGYQPTSSVSTQPPNTGSNVQPAPQKKK